MVNVIVLARSARGCRLSPRVIEDPDKLSFIPHISFMCGTRQNPAYGLPPHQLRIAKLVILKILNWCGDLPNPKPTQKAGFDLFIKGD